METNTIIFIVLVVIYLVLLAIYIRIFFYKRTMHKIHLKTGIPTANIYSVVSPNMVWGEFVVRIIKWGVVIALLFFNWIAAVVCVILGFVLPMVLPEEDDFKNMLKMMTICGNKKDSASQAMYNVIKSLLDSEFGQYKL